MYGKTAPLATVWVAISGVPCKLDLRVMQEFVELPLGESIWILANDFGENPQNLNGFCENQLRESILDKEQFQFDAQCTIHIMLHNYM